MAGPQHFGAVFGQPRAEDPAVGLVGAALDETIVLHRGHQLMHRLGRDEVPAGQLRRRQTFAALEDAERRLLLQGPPERPQPLLHPRSLGHLQALDEVGEPLAALTRPWRRALCHATTLSSVLTTSLLPSSIKLPNIGGACDARLAGSPLR